MSMKPSLEVSSRADTDVLAEKMRLAEITFDRARESLKRGDLTAEHRRYLNQLLTSMVATENIMSW